MKTVFSMPDALYFRIESLRKQFRLSRSAFCRRAVERFVEEYDASKARRPGRGKATRRTRGGKAS